VMVAEETSLMVQSAKAEENRDRTIACKEHHPRGGKTKEQKREYMRAYMKKYGQRPEVKDRHRERQRRVDVKEMARLRLMLTKYGLTKKKYDDLLYYQGGVCGVCRTAEWGSKGPAIDHDHNTGVVRGILCGSCNCAAGHMSDNSEMALKLYDYLKKHGA
jgi:hypothetical protein